MATDDPGTGASTTGGRHPSLVVISGPPGSGRTTAARTLVARRGYVAREFGALDYANPAALGRALRALSVCGGRGGLLVQIGAANGIGVVFDDLAGVRSSAALRIVRTFARTRAGPRLVVVCVVDDDDTTTTTTTTLKPSGFRTVCRAAELHVRLPGGAPTEEQVAWMARDVGFRGEATTIASVAGRLRADERTDLRAARAGLVRLRWVQKRQQPQQPRSGPASPDVPALHHDHHDHHDHNNHNNNNNNPPEPVTVVAAGSGRRDRTWGGVSATDLARAACTRGMEPGACARAASAAPRTVAALHAANLHRAVRCPRERTAFARAQTLAAMCGARAFDDEAQGIALWTGALALRMLGRPTALDGRRRLVASKLLSLQARYDAAIRAGAGVGAGTGAGTGAGPQPQ